ncbi:transmembrane and coiled-coil domains protein 2 isoform X2 [Sitodiplosis mosellana]|uniref:transmembrane and coiled-coil domains protein 2 isoform X2 n=2 Tax=Sitodiplosis mosellana TaxID=263140 RepID=UPI002444EA55|nr:transmembrane and coiled-coil domains protein 2 isoform X2 [Sitodiplosis mosellana]
MQTKTMDTLQVHSASSQNLLGGSKPSSRAPSPCRSDQMSKDRDSNDSVSGSGLRFRNQSPSTTNRRSRDRDRSTNDKGTWERDADANTMLITNEASITSPTVAGNSATTAVANVAPTGSEHSDTMDDSRLSEELGYQSFVLDELEGNTSTMERRHHHHHHRSNSGQAMDRLNTKIACTRESIRKEQTARDENVNEYLKLAANTEADKQQLHRIKAVFEKKNQKSAHTISQLQKKLEVYSKRVKDLQIQQNQRQIGHRQPREVLRDVGQGLKNVGGNVRDGITGLGGSLMSKPREFAHLIKNKFGSADNINQLSSNPDLNTLDLTGTHNNQAQNSSHHHLHSSTLGNNHTTPHTGSSNIAGTTHAVTATRTGSGKFSNENDSECSSVTSDSMPGGSGKSHSGTTNQQDAFLLKAILTEMTDRQEECAKMKEAIERLQSVQKEFQDVSRELESERYRAERLEEQVNDLTELHQNEIENLKQALADMEEKVQYQSDERLRDVNEVLENCQTRISKMEHLSQQQYVTVEGIDNSNARALIVKLINVVLTVLQVVLLLVATAAGIIMPFLKTRLRVLTTVFFVFIAIFVIRQWPDVKDIGSHMVRRLKETLIVK